MPTLREHNLLLDRPHVWVYPPTTYDLDDPGDDLPTPEWWRSVVFVDRVASKVRLKMRAARVDVTVGAGVDNYTLNGGTVGVVAIVDQAGDRIGQQITVDPLLPSTNGREYSVDLVSKTGDARSVYTVQTGFAAPFGVNVIPFEFRLVVGGTPVSPAIGATYVLDVYFWQTS